MKIDNNKQVEVQNFLIRKLIEAEAKYGSKINLEYFENMEYLKTINPIPYKTPSSGNYKYNYDSLLRYCCFSIVTEIRFVPTDRKNLPELWIHVRNNKEFQGVCISKLNDNQLKKLHKILDQEQMNIETMREKSVIDKLIIDFFRTEKALNYANQIKTLHK
jgi:hypothetical protein